MQYNANDIRIENRPMVVGLPREAYVEYFGNLPDGREFVIFRPENDWDYSDFVCIVAGRCVKVGNVIRYRDGGTTEVPTEIGRFHFPTPFQKNLKPTFDGQEIIVHERNR